MKTSTTTERSWTSTGYEGVERAVLRLNDLGGRTALVRLKAGAQIPRHLHLGTEELLVITGRIQVAGATLATGDYLFTEAGEEHDVVALEDSTLYVASQRQSPPATPETR